VGRVFESHHFPPVDVVGLEDSAHPTKAPRIVATPSGYRRSVRCAGTDTMQDKETPVLELTEQQWQALEIPNETPARLVNPLTQERFVLVSEAEYTRLTDDDYEYDDSPWTMEEMHALAWEAGQRAGWDEMTEYDDLPQGA